MRQFSDKRDEKVARHKIYQLKLEFYNTDRKMKNTNRRAFISITMHPNFMQFRQKISFKSTLEVFSSLNKHLKTALNSNKRDNSFKGVMTQSV